MPVAAVIGREDKDVSGHIVDMLNAMSYHKRIFSVATDNELVKTKDIRSLETVETKMAIGRSGFSSSDERFFTMPLRERGDEFFLALDGYILNSLKPLGRDEARSDELIAGLIDEKVKSSEDLSEAVRSVLPVLRGAFSFILMGGKSVVVARDIFGFEPLYWGEDERCVAFASERKALWKIGLRDVASVPQGCVVTADGRTKNLSRVLSLDRPPVVDLSLDAAGRMLAETLKRIFFRDFEKIREVDVLFSGGVDSSLVTKIFSDMGKKVTLYGTAVEGSYDINSISRSASELGCKLHLRTLSLDDVEDYLYKTIYAVEEADLMKVGIGLPIYAAMETANGDGARLVFTGQGADELFGGYFRYLQATRSGCEQLNDEIWKDVSQMSEVNLQRDGAIAMASDVDYCSPFLDLEVVDLAMSFPSKLKVTGPEDGMRKHVFREAAKILGLPESIADMPKKAVQYSSGSDRAIRKLSRRDGKRPTEYVRYAFRKVFREYYPGILE